MRLLALLDLLNDIHQVLLLGDRRLSGTGLIRPVIGRIRLVAGRRRLVLIARIGRSTLLRWLLLRLLRLPSLRTLGVRLAGPALRTNGLIRFLIVRIEGGVVQIISVRVRPVESTVQVDVDIDFRCLTLRL